MLYETLASELLMSMHTNRNTLPQRWVADSLRGALFILMHVVYRGGDALPGELSTELGISSARTAAALNSLEERGMVTREIDSGDRRRIIVRVTPEGRDMAEKHALEVHRFTASMLRALGEDDARTYVRIMTRLSAMRLGTQESITGAEEFLGLQDEVHSE